MAYTTDKRLSTEFKSRLVYLAEELAANAADDSRANILRSVHKIARLASDYRSVYVDACRRILEAERGAK